MENLEGIEEPQKVPPLSDLSPKFNCPISNSKIRCKDQDRGNEISIVGTLKNASEAHGK